MTPFSSANGVLSRLPRCASGARLAEPRRRAPPGSLRSVPRRDGTRASAAQDLPRLYRGRAAPCGSLARGRLSRPPEHLGEARKAGAPRQHRCWRGARDCRCAFPALSRRGAVARSWIPFRGLRSARCTRCRHRQRVSREPVLPRGPRGRGATSSAPFGVGSVDRDGRVGVHGVYRVCLTFRCGLLPLTTGHTGWLPKPPATAPTCRAPSFRRLHRCRVRALQPHRRDASRGGKTRSKSWFVGFHHRPPRPSDAFTPWPSRDPRSVRVPPLSWLSARPS